MRLNVGEDLCVLTKFHPSFIIKYKLKKTKKKKKVVDHLFILLKVRLISKSKLCTKVKHSKDNIMLYIEY